MRPNEPAEVFSGQFAKGFPHHQGRLGENLTTRSSSLCVPNHKVQVVMQLHWWWRSTRFAGLVSEHAHFFSRKLAHFSGSARGKPAISSDQEFAVR